MAVAEKCGAFVQYFVGRTCTKQATDIVREQSARTDIRLYSISQRWAKDFGMVGIGDLLKSEYVVSNNPTTNVVASLVGATVDVFVRITLPSSVRVQQPEQCTSMVNK